MTVRIRELFPRHPATEIKSVYKQFRVHDNLKYSELCYASSHTPELGSRPNGISGIAPDPENSGEYRQMEARCQFPNWIKLTMTLLEQGRAEADVWTAQYFPNVEEMLFLELSTSVSSCLYQRISPSCMVPLLDLMSLLRIVVIPWMLGGTSYVRISLKSLFLSCTGTSLNKP